MLEPAPVFLAESYTTACTIAEIYPEHRVCCTAGVMQQLAVYDLLQTSDDVFVIMVLDKTAKGEPNRAMDKLLKVIECTPGIYAIQPSKLSPDLSLIHI